MVYLKDTIHFAKIDKLFDGFLIFDSTKLNRTMVSLAKKINGLPHILWQVNALHGGVYPHNAIVGALY